MEFFLNETSLNQQFNSIQEFKNAIISMNAIFSLIEEKKKNSVFFQDSWLFQADYMALKEEIFQSSFKKINPHLQLDFKRFLKEGIKAKDWRAERIHSSNDIFTCPILDNFVTDSSLAEVAERKLQTPDIQRVLINFIESKFKNYSQITVFKNDLEKENPIKLDCLDSKQEFEKWFGNEELELILNDKKRFKKTKFIFEKSGKGTPIYKEEQTGNYWYADYFHKDNKFHFEVFNPQKIHLGEADLEGKLIPNSADSKKDGKISV